MHKYPRQAYTEPELVLSLKQGQHQALAQLYDKYSAVLLGLITRIVQDQETAEEALRETFLRIWSESDTFDPTASKLLTWMLSIARNCALDMKNRKQDQNFAEANAGTGQSNDLTATTAGQPGTANDGIRSKEPKECGLLDLLYLQGYNCAEAAAKLRVTEPSIGKSLRMAIFKLREGSKL